MTSMQTAQDISIDLLERTGAGLMSGDVSGFLSCFHVPCFVETFDGKRLLNSKLDIEDVYNSVRDYYRAHNVTDLIRECISAEFKTHETIYNTHITRLMRDDEVLFRRPFPVFSILRLLDDGWKITYSQYAIEDAPKHNKALSG